MDSCLRNIAHGRGALSKSNQAITSDLLPNSDPLKIDHLRLKHPEPAHPDPDPVRVSSILWPRSDSLQEYWSSDTGTEFVDKWFSIPKICQYFRTRSPVGCVIYCHLSKLSVGQTPRLCSLPRKSYSNNSNVPFTGGNNLVKESGEPFNGMPIEF